MHLILLINITTSYPVKIDSYPAQSVRFRIGIAPKAKPSKTAIAEAFRSHSVLSNWTDGEFESFALSATLSNLLEGRFREVLDMRRSRTSVGWAGAELHTLAQKDAAAATAMAFDKKASKAADEEEDDLDVQLPDDPMRDPSLRDNFPIIAFSYLLRRFCMCPRFCLVCNTTEYTAAANHMNADLLQTSRKRSSQALRLPRPTLPLSVHDFGPGSASRIRDLEQQQLRRLADSACVCCCG